MDDRSLIEGRFPKNLETDLVEEPAMSCSVMLPERDSIYFLTELPDQTDGLQIVEDAWVEVPMNVNLWPEGAPRPETVLFRSRCDPKHYKMFKYRREVDPREWEEAGVHFGGTFSKHSWHAFASRIPSLMAIDAIPDREGD